jgi:hypothetical protein
MYLKMEVACTILVKAYDKGIITTDKEELKKAYALGALLYA